MRATLLLTPIWANTLPVLHKQSRKQLMLQANMRLVPQLQEPNLGARMQHALQYALNCGHQRVAIVGTDVPDLSSTVVASALQSLDTYQVSRGGV